MEFLLSCISTRHSMLKKHWAQSDQEKQQTECPVTVLGSRNKPKDEQGGLVAVLDEHGNVKSSIELEMPAGMVHTDDGLLIASIYTVHKVARDLNSISDETISLPSFNMLHSLSRSKHGYLVASTGLDAIVEFNVHGESLWEWWATEHGFSQTPTGEPRVLERGIDYRGIKHGTLAQTTHVNSVAELPDGTVLATLFHQGSVIAIDRASGSWQTVLDGLNHPHSVRILNDQYITVADTGNGRGLLVKLANLRGTIETEVAAETNWLQDCSYDYQHDRWFLVDGKNSRVIVRTGNRVAHEIQVNPEWRLYEALPL